MAGWDQKTILVGFESSTFQTTPSQMPRRRAEVELCATKPGFGVRGYCLMHARVVLITSDTRLGETRVAASTSHKAPLLMKNGFPDASGDFAQSSKNDW